MHTYIRPETQQVTNGKKVFQHYMPATFCAIVMPDMKDDQTHAYVIIPQHRYIADLHADTAVARTTTKSS